jgi:cell shape-determining protein MreC
MLSTSNAWREINMVYRKREIPIETQKLIENLRAENQQLKEQVQEQADALVELAELLTEEA